MGRTTLDNLLTPGFVVDQTSLERTSGRQIDWANVNVSYIDSATGKKRIPAGTEMGELLGAGKISPRIAATNPATCILLTDAVEGPVGNATEHAKSGYGTIVGGVLYENLLPLASGSPKRLAAAVRTELDAAGCTFKWQQYEDNRL